MDVVLRGVAEWCGISLISRGGDEKNTGSRRRASKGGLPRGFAPSGTVVTALHSERETSDTSFCAIRVVFQLLNSGVSSATGAV
jgi:hypothetical protein